MASDTAINGVTAVNDYPIMEQGGSCPSSRTVRLVAYNR
jgi:hypothetical protein